LSDATELMRIIKKCALQAMLASDPMNVLFGEVIGVKPLQIDVEQKMKLGEMQLVLLRNVTDYETEVSIDTQTEEALKTHSHNLLLEMEQAGEPLHMHEITYHVDPADISHFHKIKKRMKITVHNGLAVGDRVILLRSQGGQKFLVVDRIG